VANFDAEAGGILPPAARRKGDAEMSPELPAPVAAYFGADAACDSEALAGSFADGTAVKDEGGTRVGADAIRAWWRAARARYQFDNEPLDAVNEGDRVLVRARATGDFPGSAATLRFAFELEGTGIRRLEIGA